MEWSQLWLGLGLALPTATIGYLGLRQSGKKDSDAIRSGLLSNHRDLLNEVQEELVRCRERLDATTSERDTLKFEIFRLRRKYGNGNDTPNPPSKIL